MQCKFLLTLVALLSLVSQADAQVLAFPEAEGFGQYTTGARTNLAAATVYHVTNLNDAGPGSFRDAVSQSNRFVVFDVGGIASIQSVVPVSSNITIAGQTAPGGFVIYNDRISFTGSNNLISRHFAVRKGQPGVRTDAASIARGTNMIFDHMSITWGVDGTFDINPDSGQVIDNITIQNSIVAQGLDRRRSQHGRPDAAGHRRERQRHQDAVQLTTSPAIPRFATRTSSSTTSFTAGNRTATSWEILRERRTPTSRAITSSRVPWMVAARLIAARARSISTPTTIGSTTIAMACSMARSTRATQELTWSRRQTPSPPRRR